jgi:folate-binding Fe-S cluster repair protein YgfZ
LHQREGVHFDKGCYLGQEIVARLWFKAKPKHWLHLIQSKGELPAPATQLSKDVEVVNSVVFGDGYLALVIAKPAALTELGVSVLDLPEALNGDVARPS